MKQILIITMICALLLIAGCAKVESCEKGYAECKGNVLEKCADGNLVTEECFLCMDGSCYESPAKPN